MRQYLQAVGVEGDRDQRAGKQPGECFAAGLRNFERVYRDAVDAWAIYDNAGDEPVWTNWGEKP